MTITARDGDKSDDTLDNDDSDNNNGTVMTVTTMEG